MKLFAIYLGILSLSISFVLNAGDVISNIPDEPDEPDVSEKYIFYLHGSTEESEGTTDKYESAIEAIAESSATVISEVREEANPNAYAEKIKLQVSQLIAKGVPAENITVSGFSKGSIITLSVSGIIGFVGLVLYRLVSSPSFNPSRSVSGYFGSVPQTYSWWVLRLSPSSSFGSVSYAPTSKAAPRGRGRPSRSVIPVVI